MGDSGMQTRVPFVIHQICICIVFQEDLAEFKLVVRGSSEKSGSPEGIFLIDVCAGNQLKSVC